MRIGVVIVTRNRIDCLKIALKLYDEQTKTPEYILVVNNYSTDEKTADYLNAWEKETSQYRRIVIHSKENGGGSGGFYIAEREALKLDADWIWHADDDAYPDINALEEIEKAYLFDHRNVAAFSASIKNISNKKEDLSYWMKLYKGLIFVKWIPIYSSKKYFDVDKFMYLGCVIRKDVLVKAGLTNRDFFIHEDDIEHSLRVRRLGRIVAVRDANLSHPAWSDVINPNKINWKYYYSVRNKILSIGINLGKRYWMGEVIKAKIKYFIHKIKRYPNRILMMEKTAIQDGKNGRLGKNDTYLP